jgi:hypothetical protein
MSITITSRAQGSTTMANHYDSMHAAISRAKAELDRNNDPRTNREAFRSFMADMFASFEGLAYQLGGDGSYISDEMFNVTGPRGAVDSCFLDQIDGLDEDDIAAQVAHRRAILSVSYDHSRA